jgi:hypothetical protein
MDAIDAALGYTTCTSTTRPSAPFQGQLIRETDTGSYYVCNGTAPASSSWVPIVSTEGPTVLGATGSAAPLRIQTTSTTAGNRLLDARKSGDANIAYQLDYDGHMQWGAGGATLPDTDLYRVSAGALGIKGGGLLGGFVVSNLNQITNPYTGQYAHNTSDGILYRYDGAAWKAAAALSGNAVGTRHHATFIHSVSQSIPNSSDTPIQFPQVNQPSNDVVASGAGNQVFTLQRTGQWTIVAGYGVTGNAGAGERSIMISLNPMSTAANQLLRNSVFPGANVGRLSMSMTDYFTAGAAIVIGAYQSSGVALNTDLALVNAGRVSFTYHGQEE